ncbi:MAG: hypothetical protein E4G90_01005 [Gemmatimonadales bacterium]|nr:MAG: hypothetical protein E4G90_01005 [Gemmatimonadales bacterium]
MKKTIADILLMLFIFTLASCSSPGTATPASGAVAPTATREPEPATVAPTAIPAPLPSGYTDLLQEKMASGEWSLEAGLVTMLSLFAGEIPASQADLGAGVLETEGTGILTLASGYLQTGTDQAVKDELTRLLNLLVPSQEALDRYSIPEGQASSRVPGLAAPVRQDVKKCHRLWVDGFPDLREPVFPCFLFGERKVAGNAYRVYYPLAWRGDESREPYYAATLEAAQEAITEFQEYGSVRPIYFVFSTLAYADCQQTGAEVVCGEIEPDVWASTGVGDFRPGTEACPVIINPASFAFDLPVPGQPGPYKQTIAHEIFHCFQAWNLRHQLVGPGVDSNWWGEGTAEYFSNLVYPAVNSEQEWADSFIELSNVKPLTNLSYENFAFFQFLGNRVGADGVIAMLRTMPTTPGRGAQLAALAAYPGIEETFEEFVRSVLDHTLTDSDGKRMALDIDFTEQYLFTDIANKEFSGHPFVLTRYRVSFDSEKSFAVEGLSDGDGRSAWRAFGSVGGWGTFPVTAAGGCEDLSYILYAITTTPSAVRTETVATTMVTEAPCDECLIGTWEATNDSVIAYMQSAAVGDNAPKVESAAGSMFLRFEADGTGAAGYKELVLHQRGGDYLEGAEVIVTFDGSSSGPYTADGFALTGLSGTTAISVSVQIIVDGTSLGSTTTPLRPEDFPVGLGTPTAYTCEGDSLTTWPPIEGGAVEPVVWFRVSP